MDHSQQLKDLFARGFELAWFIHPDRDQAWEIASSAHERFETVANSLEKPWKYTEPRHHTKVRLTREQVYQKLILQHSVKLQAEELKCDTALSEDTLLTYFYSTIASSLFHTNSFRANAVISRLLLRLSVEQARRLYENLRPSYRDTDDSEYSREKQVVYEVLKERFEGRVVPVTLARNEKGFAPHDNPGELQRLVEVCLERFAPWRDACPLVGQTTERRQLEPALESESAEAERNRMHIVMHCLQRFTQLVLGEAPNMLIPQFVLATSAGDPGSSLDQRSTPPPLLLEDQWRRR